MNTIPENTKVSEESLLLIEQKILANKASVKDYKVLENLMSTFGAEDYILNKFKMYGIPSYELFILERKKKFPYRNHAVDGILIGVLQGAISVLIKYLNNEL